MSLYGQFMEGIQQDFNEFKSHIDGYIQGEVECFTSDEIDVEANSYFYYECDELSVAFVSSTFSFDNITVVSSSDDSVELLLNASICIEVDSEFSLSKEDKEGIIGLGRTSESKDVNFISPITVSLSIFESGYEIENLSIVNNSVSVDFGELELS